KLGESILEVGVGTGLSAVEYPRGCRIVGIDLSAAMIERARARLARRGVDHVALCRMDAAQLGFESGRFDAVYAPYVMNVVPDPVGVARELRRVCRPDGRLVFLNHFHTADGARHGVTALLGRLASRIGVNWQVDLGALVAASGLSVQSVERVNVPR